MNRVTHFEIPCDNPEKTIAFFKDVFGWSFQQFGDEPYWIALSGDLTTPGINGAIMKKQDPNQPVANSIMVEDIDQAMIAIENAGGKIVVNKTPIPTVGWLAYFKDPDGNIHGVWQEDKNAGV
ncbi:MAG: VOC family protein [Sphingobacteriaceae bacterium]|nr:VOC family protein [Sphingobacteriaceae bacterium]